MNANPMSVGQDKTGELSGRECLNAKNYGSAHQLLVLPFPLWKILQLATKLTGRFSYAGFGYFLKDGLRITSEAN